MHLDHLKIELKEKQRRRGNSIVDDIKKSLVTEAFFLF